MLQPERQRERERERDIRYAFQTALKIMGLSRKEDYRRQMQTITQAKPIFNDSKLDNDLVNKQIKVSVMD